MDTFARSTDCVTPFWLFCGTIAAGFICGVLAIAKSRYILSSTYIMRHRITTSNGTGVSEDLNSCTNDADLGSSYLKNTYKPKQNGIISKTRQAKHKKYTKLVNNPNIKASDFDKENMVYIKSNVSKQNKSNGVQNLRKKGTTAAPLKPALIANAMLKTLDLAISPLESDLPNKKPSLYASLTASINSMSSSASNSPTHSVNTSPRASPMASKRSKQDVIKSSIKSPLKQFKKLNMNEQELAKQMQRYVIDPSLLKIYGFPVESKHHEGYVEIYKCLPKHFAEEAVTKDNRRHHRHFYGRKKCDAINDCDGLFYTSWGQKLYTDSGHSSGKSSPRFSDSDSSEMGEKDSIECIMAFYTPDGVYQIFLDYNNSFEKQCVRCFKMFQVNEKGEYLSLDTCTYHWGKLSSVYSCCQGKELSEGCSKHPLHVWNGTVVGINGPYTGFLHTQQKKPKHSKYPKIYAIDCEMSYTGLGLEVTKVTVVSFDGSLVYEHFVSTKSKIIDYNTRFSGVSENDFLPTSNRCAKTFEEVQDDLLKLFDADTILIGHGLDNDLKALRLVHKTIVDTSVIFSHSTGYPYRRSLKNLTKSFLKRDIQCGYMGHSSLEDSRACLELMMWKIRKDLRHWN